MQLLSPLIWDILSGIFSMLFVTAVPINISKYDDNILHIWEIDHNVILIALSKEMVCFYHIAKRFHSGLLTNDLHLIGQATHAWPRDARGVTSVCVPLHHQGRQALVKLQSNTIIFIPVLAPLETWSWYGSRTTLLLSEQSPVCSGFRPADTGPLFPKQMDILQQNPVKSQGQKILGLDSEIWLAPRQRCSDTIITTSNLTASRRHEIGR